MDKYDPANWTENFVLSNKMDCLNALRDDMSFVMDLVRQKKYFSAVGGLDKILEGLKVMHDSGCGDFRPHVVMLSLIEGMLVAFGMNDDDGYSEGERKETALACLKFARDHAKSDAMKEDIGEIITQIKSGESLAGIKAEQDPDFPNGELNVIDILRDIQGRMTLSYSKKPSSSGGCYIATAVYGSYDCPQVWTLRRYRDDTLALTWYGRAFIRVYYAISPTLVRWFGHDAWFRKLWKDRLDLMVKKLNAEGIENTPYEDKKRLCYR